MVTESNVKEFFDQVRKSATENNSVITCIIVQDDSNLSVSLLGLDPVSIHYTEENNLISVLDYTRFLDLTVPGDLPVLKDPDIDGLGTLENIEYTFYSGNVSIAFLFELYE